MGFLLMGRKIGMTRVYSDAGASIPVTVIQTGPCVVTQIRTPEKDGYAAVQVAFEDLKARNSTMPVIGHDAKAGIGPKRFHREFRVDAKNLSNYNVGDVISIDTIGKTMFVDVTGRSKGKGFAGVMKRYNFGGMGASHGTERKHRAPGSIGGHCSNRGFGGGLCLGKRMPGHMGDERVTQRCLDVVRVDASKNQLLVKGPVPGANRGLVLVRPSVRLYRSKAKRVAAANK